jgi:hypothetical protein
VNTRRLLLALGASTLLVCCRLGYEELPSAVQSGSGIGASAGSESSEAGADAAAEPPSGGVSNRGGNGAASGAGSTADAGAAQQPSGGANDGVAGDNARGGTDGGGSGGSGTGGVAGAAGSGGSVGGAAGSGGSSNGCTATSYGGHNYWVCTTPKSYVNAAVDCAGRGYFPLRIDSAGEQTFVHDQIPIADQNNNNTSLWRWLGATGSSGDWQWGDGEKFWTGGNQGTALNGAYTNWSNGQPGNQACLAMQARSGLWTAVDCFATHPYICEQY